MSIEILQTLTVASFIVCGVFFILSIILFFVFKIPELVNDLSGRTARKEIENIAQRTRSTGMLAHRSRNSGMLPQRMTLTGNINRSRKTTKIRELSSQLKQQGNETVQLTQNGMNETAVLAPSSTNETAVLTQNSMNETAVLAPSSMNETAVLTQNSMNETTILTQNNSVSFSVDVDICFCDSSETVD